MQNCQLISIASPVAAGVKSINGAVTAHGRATKDENSGFAFVNCTLGGTGRIWLGRAWRPYSTVVFANTFITDIVAPEGWNDFNDPSRDQLSNSIIISSKNLINRNDISYLFNIDSND